jgi:hypothetical protein
MIGPCAGDTLDQGCGTISLTLAEELLVDPTEQSMEIAPREGVIEATQFGLGRPVELGGGNAAQGIIPGPVKESLEPLLCTLACVLRFAIV